MRRGFPAFGGLFHCSTLRAIHAKEPTVAGLTRFAEKQDLSASSFTAIGAFSEALVGYFDWEKKDYEKIPVKEQTEVLALVGDIALDPASGDVRGAAPTSTTAAAGGSRITNRRRCDHVSAS